MDNATALFVCLFAVFSARTAESKDPNFGSVLYALKLSRKITRRGDQIRFNSSVCVPLPVVAVRFFGSVLLSHGDYRSLPAVWGPSVVGGCG